MVRTGQPALALLQGFDHPGQVIFDFFRQDLATFADGTFDAVPAHFGDEIGRILEIECLEGLGESDQSESFVLDGVGCGEAQGRMNRQGGARQG